MSSLCLLSLKLRLLLELLLRCLCWLLLWPDWLCWYLLLWRRCVSKIYLMRFCEVDCLKFDGYLLASWLLLWLWATAVLPPCCCGHAGCSMLLDWVCYWLLQWA